MSILVVGSVAYDSVKTHAGARQEALGGSATYFAISGSYFAPVAVVAVVGEDFKQEHTALLRAHGVDTSGLQVSPGKTFRWSGEYDMEDVNSRQTLDTSLNVFADFQPQLTPQQRQQPYLFLANIAPELQLQVLSQMESRPKLVAADTMNFWIDGNRDALAEVIKAVDVLIIDENEVRLFVAAYIKGVNVVSAARYVLDMGPRLVIVKRGEHGVVQFMRDSVFAAPAFPLDSVDDPTGAGDSFAGGFMGYLAATGDLSPTAFRKATVAGSIMGSFAVENFSVERLVSLRRADLTARFQAFTSMIQLGGTSSGSILTWLETPVSSG